MALRIEPAWHGTKTENWKIVGGPAVGMAFGIKGVSKIWYFTNLDNKKTGTFYFASLGLALAAEAKLGSIGATKADKKAINGIAAGSAHVMDATGNPFALVDIPAKTTIRRKFSFKDVIGSAGGVFSASASAGASVEAKVFVVGNTEGALFQIEAPAAELKLALGVEALGLSAGVFFPGPEFNYIKKQQFNRILKTPPSQNWILDNAK